MSISEDARRHLDIARRVAEAHRGIDDASLLALVSGSTVEDLVDERSDVDMSVVFDALPAEAVLRAACARIGGDWFWSAGALADGSLVVAFRVDGVEIQIAYATHAAIAADLDDLLSGRHPETPNHKLAEGLAKAWPLAGAERLAALQQRLREMPDALRRAMIVHALATPMPWRAAAQLPHRDAALWSREIQVEACYRLLLMLGGLNGVWFTRFQLKRMRRLAARLAIAPPHWVERVEGLLAAPPAQAFAALHALEGEVLALVAAHRPDVDVATALARHAGFGQ